ncbi:hypothetical protein HMPREF0591_4995 [Mycobacterium parascrofulaceum ATCC BAA-614]|uniref:Uncharacterized protein n=1 Tax=Mycobacterium parascrofulaceum ATCC BAA-614 TaxID=525368 RepID=D5PFQ1_9MYCO|nr:hypothetical protein HMPREF0591_4995 [Mycobacterium parascrofulaceum ATCC BAA-614]
MQQYTVPSGTVHSPMLPPRKQLMTPNSQFGYRSRGQAGRR